MLAKLIFPMGNTVCSLPYANARKVEYVLYDVNDMYRIDNNRVCMCIIFSGIK